MGIDAERLVTDKTLTGKLFENFVSSELFKQAVWSGIRLKIYHFRAHTG